MSTVAARAPRRSAAKRRRRRCWRAVAARGRRDLVGHWSGPETVRELTLPLRHDDIIRQQARDKGVDPNLIAAIIYEESRFRDQTSHAGARGLMQITPATARFIARDSGGAAFTQRDLATPQINIAYGTYYLRYLLRRYDGNEELAVAAYNAGETNVDRWVRRAGGPEAFDKLEDIPFPETRAYVKNVERSKRSYEQHYSKELDVYSAVDAERRRRRREQRAARRAPAPGHRRQRVRPAGRPARGRLAGRRRRGGPSAPPRRTARPSRRSCRAAAARCSPRSGWWASTARPRTRSSARWGSAPPPQAGRRLERQARPTAGPGGPGCRPSS